MTSTLDGNNLLIILRIGTNVLCCSNRKRERSVHISWRARMSIAFIATSINDNLLWVTFCERRQLWFFLLFLTPSNGRWRPYVSTINHRLESMFLCAHAWGGNSDGVESCDDSSSEFIVWYKIATWFCVLVVPEDFPWNISEPSICFIYLILKQTKMYRKKARAGKRHVSIHFTQTNIIAIGLRWWMWIENNWTEQKSRRFRVYRETTWMLGIRRKLRTTLFSIDVHVVHALFGQV